MNIFVIPYFYDIQARPACLQFAGLISNSVLSIVSTRTAFLQKTKKWKTKNNIIQKELEIVFTKNKYNIMQTFIFLIVQSPIHENY